MIYLLGSLSALGQYLWHRLEQDQIKYIPFGTSPSHHSVNSPFKYTQSYLDIDFSELNENDIVVFSSGIGDVRFCEHNADLSEYKNLVVPTKISSICQDIGCKFIYFSSAAVFGNPQFGHISFDTPYSPISLYGHHKMLAEQFLLQQSCSYIFRMFSTYGPFQKKMLVFDILSKVQTNFTEKSITLTGSPDSSRDFLHHEAVYQSLLSIINAQDKSHIHNIASGKSITVAHLCSMILDELGLNDFQVYYQNSS